MGSVPVSPDTIKLRAFAPVEMRAIDSVVQERSVKSAAVSPSSPVTLAHPTASDVGDMRHMQQFPGIAGTLFQLTS